jgi:hypothetical protein
VLSSTLWGRSVSEAIYRVFRCRRCATEVRVCRRCDHGQVYCLGECSRICRRESLQRAGARYQQTRRGAHRHAARQRRWRERQIQRALLKPKIVTHHPCSTASVKCMLSAAQRTGEQADADAHKNNNYNGSAVVFVCHFCHARLDETASEAVTGDGAGVASAGAAVRGSA